MHSMVGAPAIIRGGGGGESHLPMLDRAELVKKKFLTYVCVLVCVCVCVCACVCVCVCVCVCLCVCVWCVCVVYVCGV